jgi:hypothetical protein
LKEQNTYPNILKKDLRKTRNLIYKLWKKEGKRPLSGMGQKREESGTHNTQEKTLQHTSMENFFVTVAETVILETFQLQNQKESVTAQKLVFHKQEETLELTMKKELAQIVVTDSLSINTQRNLDAQTYVHAKYLKNQKTYNIEVEGEHEYFANGILVGNCDALEYMCFRLVTSDIDFRDIYEVARHMNQAQKIRVGRAA